MAKEKKDLKFEIEIPGDIVANITEGVLTMKKDSNEIQRKINPVLDVKLNGNILLISSEKNTKTERKIAGTMKAHVNNMIKGLNEGFKYKLNIANVHFPMNVSYDEGKNIFTVKNFLGEKKDRIIKGHEEVKVKVDKEVIELESVNIERAGQVATNLEKGTKVRHRDRRIFQDGIFIVEKPGRAFL